MRESCNVQRQAYQNVPKAAIQREFSEPIKSEPDALLTVTTNECKTELDIDIKEEVIEPVEEIEQNKLNLKEEPSQHVDLINSSTKKRTNKKHYKCDSCNYKCNYRKKSLNWIIQRHLDLASHCRKCDFHCLKPAELNKHEASCNAVLKCNFCSQEFDLKSDFAKHCQKRNGEKNFKCRKCNFYYLRKCALVNHMNRVHGGLLKCTKCNYRSVFEDELKVHTQSHTDNRPSKPSITKGNECTKCNYRSVFEDELKVHMQSHTDNRPSKPSITKKRVHNNKQYMCEKCGKSFCFFKHLEQHFLTHTGEKPYKCKLCPKEFSASSSRKKHMLTHSGSKPFCCSVCDYKCTTQDRLKCHMRIHTGEKPFKCLICDYKCSYKVSLQNHMQVHTGEQFCCELCDYESSDKVSLKRHVKSHN